MKTFSAAEANRQRSAVLREVAQGERVLVTSRGKPGATVEPMLRRGGPARTGAVKRSLLAHLATVKAGGKRTWTRDGQYDR